MSPVPILESSADSFWFQIAVAVEGFLNEFDQVGTVTINGYVWPPFVDDTHMFTIHEL